MRAYLLSWALLIPLGCAWMLLDSGGLLPFLARDPGFVRVSQLGLARHSPDGPGQVLLFGDSVTVVRNRRDAEDAKVFDLKDNLAWILSRSGRGLEVQNQALEGDYAPHFMARAQAIQRWGLRYRLALIPINPRSLNREGLLGGFQPDRFLRGYLRPADALRTSDRSAPLSALAGIGLDAADQALAHGELASLFRACAGAFRAGLVGALKLAPSREDLEAMAFERTTPGQRVARAYGKVDGVPSRTLQDLIATGRALREAGTPPLFYVTPVDQAAIEAALPDHGAALQRALDGLLAALRAEGFEARDASHLFQGGFFDPGTEHLAARQRVALAQWLADWVLRETALPPEKIKSRPEGRLFFIQDGPRVRPAPAPSPAHPST